MAGGPLAGVRVIELEGLGALPYAALRLADMGAEVIRVERPRAAAASAGAGGPGAAAAGGSFWDRGRRAITVDLKRPDGAETVLRLAESAEVFLESLRPGVAERLGLGPEVVLGRRPRIVYGRLSGFGQDGPLAQAAGHSLNYEALSGLVRAIGPRGGPPVPLLNVLGDFAGGGMHLAYGVVCALVEARRSGEGQVVDVAMTDAAVALAAPFYAMAESGLHGERMGENLFDGGAPHYNVYETADGRFVSVAPIEPRFWTLLLEKLGLDPETLPDRQDPASWPALRERLAEVFRTRTRDEWCALLEGTDACFAPVLSFSEAVRHPHHRARELFEDGAPLPAPRPVPRFSRTPGEPAPPPAGPGADGEALLREAGFSQAEIARLRAEGTVG